MKKYILLLVCFMASLGSWAQYFPPSTPFLFIETDTNVFHIACGEKITIEYHFYDPNKDVGGCGVNLQDLHIRFATDNPRVAIANYCGVVTGNAEGTATIRVYIEEYPTISCNCLVVVGSGSSSEAPQPPPSLDITHGVEFRWNTSNITLTAGNSQQLHLQYYADIHLSSMQWSSSNPAVAEVSSSGEVFAKSQGTATITVSHPSGQSTAKCVVTVEPAPEVLVSSVYFGMKNCIIENETVEPFNLVVTPQRATDKRLLWKSSDASVVRVTDSSKGFIKGVSEGEATITATTMDGSNISRSVNVKVIRNPIRISFLSIDPYRNTHVGESITLEPHFIPEDATDKTVLWTSLDPTIAKVSPEGVVTGLSVGETTIRALSQDGSNKSDECIITVEPYYVESVDLSTKEITLLVGNTFQVEATVLPNNATDKTLEWTSENPSVSWVSPNGIVMAESVGSTWITATSYDRFDDIGPFGQCVVTVGDIPVSEVSLIKEIGIDVGEIRNIPWRVSPSNAADKNLVWSSSDTSVAVVSTDGHVKGISEGVAKIIATARDGAGAADTCIVAVGNILVKSISLCLSYTETIRVGQETTVRATVLPSYAKDTSLTWTSSDETVATITSTFSEEGSCYVKGVSPGSAIITATAKDGSGVYGSCTVTVNVAVSSISVTPSTASLAVGDTQQLSATVSPSNAINKSVIWTSSDTSVATVSSTGLVTAKAKGTVTIKATAADGSGVYGSCTVTVKYIAVSSISVTPQTASLTIGDTLRLSATVSPSNATNKNVTWSSDNTSIATISSTGLVTAKAAGTVTIKADIHDRLGGKNVRDYCTLTVHDRYVQSVSVTPKTASLTIGDTLQLSATVSPSNATDKSVRWLSFNDSIATVSSTGLVTAKAAGTVKIRGDANGAYFLSSAYDYCLVTVTNGTTPTNTYAITVTLHR
ncbi:MAG: Ig-like domain-containing protein [Bacteroidales bacterium]|nr:Ig-like domain-containing protein [Candidatus Equimonas faecalis]